MNAEYEEIQTKLVATMLAIMDLHEKFSTYGTKEITSCVASTITSKTKKPAIVNQLYKLETQIEELRTSFAKASMKALLVPTGEDPSPTEVEEKKTDEGGGKKETVPAPKSAKAKKGVEKAEEVEIPEKASGGAGAPPDPASKPVKAKKGIERVEKVEKVEKDEKAEKAVAEKAEPAPKPTKSKKVAEVAEVVAEKPSVAVVEPPPPLKEESNPSVSEEKIDEESAPLHIRRKNIPKHVRTMVWNVHMGINNLEAKCFSCRAEKVDARNFQCGHVIAESKGGDMTIKNLRPICQPCNASMGTQSMNEFTKEYFGWEV